MIAANYTMDLYCDNQKATTAWQGTPKPGQHEYNEFPHQFIAEHGATARKEARKAGWKFDWKEGIAVCPSCVKAGVMPKDCKTDGRK